MNLEPVLIIGAIDAAAQAAQIAFVGNRVLNGILGAVVAGLGFIVARSRVTPV